MATKSFRWPKDEQEVKEREAAGLWRAQTPTLPKSGAGKAYKKALAKRNDAVVDLATWTQYQIAAIHPFCEGNGRMARLMTNLILHRFNLQPTDIKYEGENKIAYLDALGKIDKDGDYRHLKHLIVKGMITSYQKLIAVQKRIVK